MTGGDDVVAIAVEPAGTSHWLERRGGDVWLADAVVAGGGRVVGPAEATGMVWCETSEPDALRAVLDAHPAIEWVQLPFAGIEPYAGVLDDRHVWTCAKRAYAAAVAEHALALMLAGLRGLWPYARASSWVADHGRNLYGAHVVVLGGGGIAEALLGLLEPFGCETTCVRRHPTPVPGADRTVTDDALDEVLDGADVVVLAVPLTPATTGIIDEAALRRMPEHAWLVNVGRGRLVVTDDLVTALREGWIAGAALDVTDPEPLPDGHPLWTLDNCLVTPHVANTHAMLRPRLVELVTENVRRFGAGEPLLGLIDVAAGY